MAGVTERRGCRVSDGGSAPRRERRGITARWAPLHGPRAAESCTFPHARKHSREKEDARGPRGANGLLLKTCITPRRRATTHVAAARPSGITAAPALR